MSDSREKPKEVEISNNQTSLAEFMIKVLENSEKRRTSIIHLKETSEFEFLSNLDLKIKVFPPFTEIKTLFEREIHGKLHFWYFWKGLFLIRLFIRNYSKKFNKNWNISEKILLSWVVYHFLLLNEIKSDGDLVKFGQNISYIGSKTKKQWDYLAQLLEKSYIECAFKFNSLKISQPQTKLWSSEEDKLLSSLVKF